MILKEKSSKSTVSAKNKIRHMPLAFPRGYRIEHALWSSAERLEPLSTFVTTALTVIAAGKSIGQSSIPSLIRLRTFYPHYLYVP